MSSAKQHNEWLSLIEVSGPFLSLPVLLETFPQGLDAHDPELFRRLGGAHDEWRDAIDGRAAAPAVHSAWIRFVLEQVLGHRPGDIREGQAIPPALVAYLPEHSETLRPDFAVVDPVDGTPRLIVAIVPAAHDDLERPLAGRAGSTWRASPHTRMAAHLRASGLRIGLVTNGEQWTLVDSPRDGTAGFATWEVGYWRDEKVTLQAFRSLLGAERLHALAGLLAKSGEHQAEVTDQLGRQVRRAVEVLVQTLDRVDEQSGRQILKGVAETEVYEAALTVMMRLVFLFSAEEKKLFPVDDPLYAEHYAVSTLRERLRADADRHTEDFLARNGDAWCRLLAAFRAVHGGIAHDRLRLPAYGGSLFDPDRFPFLEGRARGTTWRETPAEPVPIDNRTVLHLLGALQELRVKVPGGGTEAQRVSFRALDIEQIGHVYEGLLDHTAVRARDVVLGLGGAGEPEVPIACLEELREKGGDALVDYLHEETGRSAAALKKAVAARYDVDHDAGFVKSCGTGEPGALLRERLAPFAGLVRKDSYGEPVVIRAGALYVTAGSDRRSTGTHYTPKSLTEPVVEHALDPLVYAGPAEGKQREQWQLRTARELLDLRVCDLACGSGAFLVQACRYLAEKLQQAWAAVEGESPGALRITPEGTPATGAAGERLLPKDPDERAAIARRLVAQRCLYGVDKNPLAVEMAKLSLWLLTLAKDKPFTFLDHAIRCGDSLVGIHDVVQLRHFNLKGEVRAIGMWERFPLAKLIEDAIELRLKLERTVSDNVEDVAAQRALLAEAEAKTAQLEAAADFLVAAEFGAKSDRERDTRRDQAAMEVHALLGNASEAKFAEAARQALGRRRFHWPLEFPEVVVRRGGFDAVLGNPPFMGGQKITGALGKDYRNLLVEQVAQGKSGSADLCAYFFLRARQLVRDGGGFAMLATNTLAQGDTREVGLEQLVSDGAHIVRAVPTQKWPGEANLEIATVWVRRGAWAAPAMLDGRAVERISAFLSVPSRAQGVPQRLATNAGRSFQGSIVLGMGFVLEPAEAEALIGKDPRNCEVVLPYLNGEDLNSRWDQSPSRFVINFRDWPLDRATAPAGYRGPLAEDYPACLSIVRERSKPERDRLASGDATARDRARRWWQFARSTLNLYATIGGMERVLVKSEVGNRLSFALVPNGIVYSHMLIVFAFSKATEMSLLQSGLHEAWAREYASSMRSDLRYTPTDCFETFPFPPDLRPLATLGERYHVHRASIMSTRREGLTKTYNRFHSPGESSPDIRTLRDLHAEMDRAVAAAYGWSDLALDHGFHETKQGLRFTISEPARREVLDRLLELNHARYAEEVAAGLHEKNRKKPKAPKSPARAPKQPNPTSNLFGEDL